MNYFDDFIKTTETISSMPDADFTLAKVAKFDEDIAEIMGSAKLQIERIKLWEESRIEQLEKQKQYFVAMLHSYINASGKKTEKLVNGTLTLRKQSDEIIVENEEAVMLDNRFVRESISLKIDKSALRKHYQSTGEVVDGIKIKPRQPKFAYKLNRG